MRIVESQIGDIRRRVFTEVARLGYEGGDYKRIDELPYKMLPGEISTYRESIFLERAIIGERLRLAIGLPLRSIEEHSSISGGIEDSAIDKKFYDPPLVNIIKFACHACKDEFMVTDACQGCLARPCVEVCPTKAVSMKNNRSVIDMDKCIKCGRCEDVCYYKAIVHLKRPCAQACGIDAIGDDVHGRADINYDKCVSCGMCIVNCPFGAITDKGQIFQLIHSINSGDEVVAMLAPAFVGQFGSKVTPEKLVTALKALGFSKVAEVAQGADLCAIEEAHDFLEKVPEELPFMATSCCPAWSAMAKKQFPEIAHCISMALTPMVLTARMLKQENPNCRIVFIGPCAAKKLEASRRSVRSNVDFVLTFEELMGMFEAKGIVPAEMQADEESFGLASAAGRSFPVGGGVAKAVVEVIKQIEPEREIRTVAADGLRACHALLKEAVAGKHDGCLLEGMGCPGGCVAGTGTIVPAKKVKVLVDRFARNSSMENPLENHRTLAPEMYAEPE